MGWSDGTQNDILHITVIWANQQVTYFLLKEYGLLKPDKIRVHAAAYVQDSTHQAQNNWMMYKCIMKSLDGEGRLKITSEPEKISCGSGTRVALKRNAV